MLATASVSTTPGSLLVRAVELTRKGNYTGSLKILDNIPHDPKIPHTVTLEARIDLQYARNHMKLGNDASAWLYIDKIPHGLGDSMPHIDADLRSITGILYRREAYELFKNGRITEAIEKADRALMEFGIAEASAIMDSENGLRLFHNCHLNRAYTEGLKLYIEGAPNEMYRPLVVAAVIAEYYSRRKMDDDTRDWISGITVIVDLSKAAGLALKDMANISDDPEYQKAYFGIIGHSKDNYSWPQFLLRLCAPCYISRTCDDHKSCVINVGPMQALQPETIAKALLLGCKIVRDEDPLDAALLIDYASQLQYYSGILAQGDRSPKLRHQISTMIQSLPDSVYRRRLCYYK